MPYLNEDDKIFRGISDKYKVEDKLPPKILVAKYDSKWDEYYLESSKLKRFKSPKKIFNESEVISDVEKYFRTFQEVDSNVGVMSKGLKGTGKSLVSKLLCNKALDEGIPVIQILDPFSGTGFLDFINSIDQDVAIFIDEFDDLYSFNHDSMRNTQEFLLSLLDGAVENNHKRLTILTANDGDLVDALLNRTGRIRYFKEYDKLSDKTVDEILDFYLESKDNIKEVKRILTIVGKPNIDIVKSLCEEVNMYKNSDSSIVDIANSMNIRPEQELFTVEWFKETGISTNKSKEIYNSIIGFHPLHRENIYLNQDEIEVVQGSGPKPSNICIKISKSKILEVSDVIRISCDGVEYKFIPYNKFRFVFKEENT